MDLQKFIDALNAFEANRQKSEIQNTSDYQEISLNDPDSDDDYNMITGGMA